MSKLANKTVLITGGGSGIGLAVARRCLDEGAHVAIAGRDEAKLRSAAEQLKGGDRLLFAAADVSQASQAQNLINTVTTKWGRIDILVNNAGSNIKERTILELNAERWKQLMGANLDGAFFCMTAVLPQMVERREGLIINVNSISGKRANPLGGSAYNAAKFGLTGLASSVALRSKIRGFGLAAFFRGKSTRRF